MDACWSLFRNVTSSLDEPPDSAGLLDPYAGGSERLPGYGGGGGRTYPAGGAGGGRLGIDGGVKALLGVTIFTGR